MVYQTPNLSLVSFRNARIVNAVAEKEVYKIGGNIKSLVYDKAI